MKNFNVAWLTTNRTCNNKCNWCYAKNSLSKTTIMDFAKAKMAVDELKRRGVKRIVLIGGEPTIYTNFFELITYIHENNIKVRIASNGRLFKDISFAQRVKDAGVDGIDISIKATDEDSYYRNTNAYGLNEMVEGYHNLKKVGVRTSASYVVVNDSKEEFDNLINFLEREKFTSISIQFVKPVLSLNQKETIMRLDDMGKFVGYIYSRMKETNIKYGIEVSFPICLIDEEIFDNLVREGRINNCCHVPKGNGINFDEDFKVIPCNHFADFPFSDAIDFSDDNALDKLMETDIVKEFRRKARSYPTEKCIKCDKWDICGGGCFTRWLMDDPNQYIK
ncbi:MAG: radical SAM protein [Clostridia bacterium]|nr:radical SAM protein [Clostridia bacterium]